jgi:hypothetical protein
VATTATELAEKVADLDPANTSVIFLLHDNSVYTSANSPMVTESSLVAEGWKISCGGQTNHCKQGHTAGAFQLTPAYF